MATELFTAIKGGDKVAVETLLERDRALVDARDEKGLSPILTALYRGESDIAAAILRREPKLSVFEATAAGDATRVREIVGRDRARANAVAPDGYSGLGLAAFFKAARGRALPARSWRRPAAGVTPGRLYAAAFHGGDGCRPGRHRDRADVAGQGSRPEREEPVRTHPAAYGRLHRRPREPRSAAEARRRSGVKDNDGKTAAEIARERGNQEVADLLVLVARTVGY